MSVSIGAQGSQVYVQLEHKGQSVQIPCKDKAEAEQVAAAAVEVEKEIEKQESVKEAKGPATNPVSSPQVQVPQVDLTQSTPPENVGKKLDLKGV